MPVTKPLAPGEKRYVTYLSRLDDNGVRWSVKLTDEDLAQHGLSPAPDTDIPPDHPLWNLLDDKGRAKPRA